MQSFSKPLTALEDDAKWFARATEVRLLHVTCSPPLRSTALKVLVGFIEFHLDNKSPMLVLEEPHIAQDPGWRARSHHMVDDWEGRVRVLAGEGIEQESLAGQGPASEDQLIAFGGWVNLISKSVRPPLEGLVVQLAPARIEHAAAFERELMSLVLSPELAGVRWVIVDMEEAPLDSLHEALGDAALRCECLLDDAAHADDLEAMMAGVDPEGPPGARVGGAWPRGVIVPPRIGDPPPPTDAQRAEVDAALRAAGVSPQLVGPDAARMQQYMLAASVALKRGDAEQAIQHQAEAARIARTLEVPRIALIQQMVLAGYKMSAQLEPEAQAEYRDVAREAEAQGYDLERAQANLALALLESKEAHYAEAAAHYATAADASVRASATGLAIECWRLAGQLLVEAGSSGRARECFERAIELAEQSEPEIARGSSAPEAARNLAAHLRERGLGAQADSLEHTANRLEEGMPRSVEALL